MQADVAQRAAHQLLHVDHAELLQQAREAHVGVVAASDDQYQHRRQQADVEGLHGCLADVAEDLLRSVVGRGEADGFQWVEVILRLVGQHGGHLVGVYLVGQAGGIRSPRELQQCRAAPVVGGRSRQHVEAQERLLTFPEHRRHFVRLPVPAFHLYLDVLPHGLPASEELAGTGSAQGHLVRLAECLLQASFRRTVVEEAGQRRVGREDDEVAFHLLPVHLAADQVQRAHAQVVFHLGIAVLQPLGDFGGGVGHALALVHRVVLLQEDDAVAVGVAPLQPVFMYEIRHQQIGAGQSQGQTGHGDEEEHLVPPPAPENHFQCYVQYHSRYCNILLFSR